ncbi:4'-phosphopantetheinyl transferase family protein [Streptomyces sp. NBC_01766]|uniref:4'-phosphopantetheinyl transferase family protein n=1 Tax=Streptomyces sp. NBC_01766 TaxID=2975936 RepID=UPI002DDA6A1A|nr:4'-phosphopantetheinyl transferase superfamily protein [Streptomyces sp. NBC_01766]WSC19421.1 4'-phosphopantetheinyl transferase superfamily protein [Streptomyces sp. NBC_01766]
MTTPRLLLLEASSAHRAAPGRAGAAAVWLVDAVRQGPVAFRLAPDVLDAEEKERAAAFRREQDRRCYVAAHVALRVVLGEHLGTEPGGIPLVREPCTGCGGPHGRPVIADVPVHFSLSHSGDLALLAVAAVPVGVDVEAVPSPVVVREVGERLHPRERAELARLPEERRPEAFARVWARKEAYLKGLGVGLVRGIGLDYVGTDASAVNPRPGWSVGDVEVPEGFAGAVAVASSEYAGL